MPALSDPRWEKACQNLALGGTKTEAYAKAGFKSNQAAASIFFKRPHIAARVQELQEQRFAAERKATEIATKKAGLDEAWVIERLKYGIELALRGEPEIGPDGNPTGKFNGKRNLNAFSRLIAVAADIKGMRIQRHEVGQPGDFARMNDDELDQALLEQARKVGIPTEAIAGLLSGPLSGERSN